MEEMEVPYLYSCNKIVLAEALGGGGKINDGVHHLRGEGGNVTLFVFSSKMMGLWDSGRGRVVCMRDGRLGALGWYV